MKKNFYTIISIILVLSTIFAFNVFASEQKFPDVDFDGEVSAADARLILRYSVGLEEFNDEQFTMADLNDNGQITSADARIALRIAVGLDNAFDEPTNTPTEPSTEPEEITTGYEETTTEYEEPSTYPWDVEGYDDSNLNYISIKDLSPERAGLIYRENGYITTYEELAEGEFYWTYDEAGVLQGRHKPYSPGNEPTTIDFSICQYCGKNCLDTSDGRFACAAGGCTRWIQDIICPECGVFVKGGTCHTCGE